MVPACRKQRTDDKRPSFRDGNGMGIGSKERKPSAWERVCIEK